MDLTASEGNPGLNIELVVIYYYYSTFDIDPHPTTAGLGDSELAMRYDELWDVNMG